MTIRVRILLAMLLIIVLPVGGSLIWLDHYLKATHIKDGDQKLVLLGKSVTSDADRFLRTVKERVLSDSRIPAFADAFSSPDRAREDEIGVLLNNIASRYPVFMLSAALVDLDGTIRFDSKARAKPHPETNQAYLQEAHSSGLPVVQLQGQQLVVAAAVRSSNGQVLGVLRLRFLMDRLNQVLIEPLRTPTVPQLRLTLFDALGHRLADSQISRQQPGQNAPVVTQEGDDIEPSPALSGPDGGKTERTYLQGEQRQLRLDLNEVPWYLLLSLPDAAFMADFKVARSRLLLVSAIAVTALLLAAWIAAQSISRPILKLTEHAEAIARDRRGQLLAISDSGEVGRLSQVLNQMLTRLQAAMEELAQANSSLEQRVEERTQDLDQTVLRLQYTQEQLVATEKLAALGALVAGVAHELNTPLGNCLLIATSFEDRLGGFLRQFERDQLRRSDLQYLLEEAQHSAELLRINLSRATELVQSFKQVAVDQTSQQRREFDLTEVVQETLRALTPSLKRQPVEIILDGAEGLMMDSYPGAVSQIVTNLVSNALIHGLSGSESGWVKVQTSADADGQRILEVSDNGSGIQTPILQRIFEPFFTTKLGEGSSGLGLSIVYNLVKGGLGGRIEVRNLRDGGVSFRIQLPAVAPMSRSDSTDVLDSNFH